MKLLFDHNLSRRLVEMLKRDFPDSGHVTEFGLETATDRAIWDHAAATSGIGQIQTASESQC